MVSRSSGTPLDKDGFQKLVTKSRSMSIWINFVGTPKVDEFTKLVSMSINFGALVEQDFQPLEPARLPHRRRSCPWGGSRRRSWTRSGAVTTGRGDCSCLQLLLEYLYTQ